jgi:hypothetical protein
MLTQRHRWCFGAMQILRLHWRSLMPWDRSPDNHLTSAQRRDYLMASLGWFRDLLMLAFSLLLLAITGLVVTHSRVAISPMDGHRSLLPLSLIIVATICMQWTLRHWTTMSVRRTLLSLVVSLSVTWVVALGCIEGVARRDGVFLRTAKASSRRSILRALRLTRVPAILAAALYISTGLLASLRDKPWVLMVIVFLQGTVYLCGPVASVWGLWAQGIPREESWRRFESGSLRSRRRRRVWAQVPQRAVAAVTAVCVGGVASAFVAPVALLHATAGPRRAVSAHSLLPGIAGTEAYLKLGSPVSRASRAYYSITSVHLSTTSAHVRLRFDTSSVELLGEVLRAAAQGGRIRHITLALRLPGLSGRPMTELADTFATAVVSSFDEHLSATPAGIVSLVLPAVSRLINSPSALQRVGPFADRSGRAPATKVYVKVGAARRTGTGSHTVTGVDISQTAVRAPIDLRFSTSSLPLLDAIFRDQGAAEVIPALTLTVRDRERGRPFATALKDTFSGVSIGSFTENFSQSPFGTATLVVSPR